MSSPCTGRPRTLGQSTGRPYIAAELGCNHCGSEAVAHRMVDACAEAGADAVKIQLRDVWLNPPADWADRVYTGADSYGATYLEHRRALELERSEYASVVAHAHDRGLECGASIWDPQSLGTAMAIGVDWLKAPSALIAHAPVMRALEWAAVYHGYPIVISLGMSTEAEVKSAVEDYAWPEGKLTLLHCVSAYPLKNEQAHLACIDLIRSLWGHRARVGVSGHWVGVQLDVFAFGRYNVEFVERHFTLDHTQKGTDHRASLEPAGLARLVRDLRECESAVGDRRFAVRECEESARRKLRGS